MSSVLIDGMEIDAVSHYLNDMGISFANRQAPTYTNLFTLNPM